MILTAIYDSVAKCFQFPTFAPNEATAVRSFEQACLDPSLPLGKYPDFELVKIGEFSEISGVSCCDHTLLCSSEKFCKKECSV